MAKDVAQRRTRRAVGVLVDGRRIRQTVRLRRRKTKAMRSARPIDPIVSGTPRPMRESRAPVAAAPAGATRFGPATAPTVEPQTTVAIVPARRSASRGRRRYSGRAGPPRSRSRSSRGRRGRAGWIPPGSRWGPPPPSAPTVMPVRTPGRRPARSMRSDSLGSPPPPSRASSPWSAGHRPRRCRHLRGDQRARGHGRDCRSCRARRR